jgi:hypothetical protein
MGRRLICDMARSEAERNLGESAFELVSSDREVWVRQFSEARKRNTLRRGGVTATHRAGG